MWDINAWASWWSGFSHYTSIIFNIPSMNFKSPDFNRTDVGIAYFSNFSGERALPADFVVTEPRTDYADYLRLGQAYSLHEAIERAFEKVRAGDMRGAKTECDRLLIDRTVNFYVYYLSGIISSQQQHWNLARKRFRQALGVSSDVPADRATDATIRLKEAEAMVQRCDQEQ